MTIELAKDVEEFLREQVRNGVCADPSQLANEALRALSDQRRRLLGLTPQLEAWLLESADSPSTPLLSDDFEEIRERAQRRTLNQK